MTIKSLLFARGPAIAVDLENQPTENAAPFAKAIGLTSPRIMSLGHAFLKQFRTVWDYQNSTLYLLKR